MDCVNSLFKKKKKKVKKFARAGYITLYILSVK